MNKNELDCKKLNLGSGPEVIEGWINIDYALGAKLNKNIIFRNIFCER